MTRLFAGTPFDMPPRCEECGELESQCVCTPEEKARAEDRREKERAHREKEANRLPPDQQTAQVTVHRRKGGRQVTVVEGLTAKANDLPQLLSRLQAECGTGGTVKAKQDLVELQGDHVEQVRQTLSEIGYLL